MAISKPEVHKLLLEAFPRAQVALEEELEWKPSNYLVVAVFTGEAASEGHETELITQLNAYLLRANNLYKLC